MITNILFYEQCPEMRCLTVIGANEVKMPVLEWDVLDGKLPAIDFYQSIGAH